MNGFVVKSLHTCLIHSLDEFLEVTTLAQNKNLLNFNSIIMKLSKDYSSTIDK